MMVNPNCHWVIARLPLGAGGVGASLDDSSTASDLALDEVLSIRRHLSGCPACRQYEASMHRATEALAVAALNPPVPAGSRSLWHDLERRIAQHKELHPASTSASGMARAATFARVPNAVLGWVRSWSDQRSRTSWLRDEARELLDLAIDRLRLIPRPRLVLIAASGLAAVIIVIRVGLPALHEREVASNAVILANESARAESNSGMQSPFLESAEQVASPNDGDDLSDRQLAQVDPAPVREADTAAPAAARVDQAPVAKAVTPPTRFNFDLDRGTPMPPDSRDPKPVY